MEIKHTNVNIPKEKPFENCKLNRAPIAEIIHQVNYTHKY